MTPLEILARNARVFGIHLRVEAEQMTDAAHPVTVFIVSMRARDGRIYRGLGRSVTDAAAQLEEKRPWAIDERGNKAPLPTYNPKGGA